MRHDSSYLPVGIASRAATPSGLVRSGHRSPSRHPCPYSAPVFSSALRCAAVRPVVGGGRGPPGRFRPAVLATAVSFIASDFFYAPPFYSLRVGQTVDVIALVTFVVVAAAVGGLVDVLTRQAFRVAGVSAEGDNPARLAAQTLIGDDDTVDPQRQHRTKRK
jgi:Domain of unknown function (DUF4118)